MKDNIKIYERYKEETIKELINAIENQTVKLDNLNDLQINNLISYYSYQIQLNKEKIKSIREVVHKNDYNKSRLYFN